MRKAPARCLAALPPVIAAIGIAGCATLAGLDEDYVAGSVDGTGAAGASTSTSGTGATGGTGSSATTGGSGGTATGSTSATGGTATGSTSATGGGGGSTSYDPTWWDPAYKKRWPIHISAPTPLPEGFQVPLPVEASNIDNANAPFDAWRIVRFDGSAWSESTRLIETVAGNQWIWFCTETAVAGSDDSYWLYAANPSAPAPPGGQSVFDFYGALGQANATAWAETGNVFHDGWQAILDGAGSGGSIRTNGTTFGSNRGVDFAMTVITPLASTSVWLCGGFQREADFNNTIPWILWISRNPGQIDVESYITPDDWKGSNVPPAVGSEHVYSVERFDTKNVFLYDLAEQDSNTWTSAYTQALQIRFSAYNGSKIGVRWARIRRTADPPPDATLATAETHP
jgi:hypothetical protein